MGRYFSVVSALPSTVFFAYVYVLIRTGAWSGPVRWSAVVDFDPAQLVVVGLAALVLSLALNPLQVELIRLFEGYWGSRPLAQELATMRIMHHRRALAAHRGEATAAAKDLDAERLADDDAPPETVARAVRLFTHNRAAAGYPERPSQVLPTRLGNVLRSYESRVGRPYGIDAIRTVPRLAMVAGEREIAYLENQRTQLELAIRTALLSLLAAVVTTFFFWWHGWWLLLALVPYAVAFLSYRGSVALAHEYGLSMAVLVDLGRFPLYDAMRLPSPRSHDAEYAQNQRLMDVFGFGGANLGRYAEPVAATSPPDGPPPGGPSPDADTQEA
ncbi:hypothetical protein ACQP2F_22600 [Actinoplanes sp. CA-030573]|uniref:hypothetical protein n=1 Tax=Actinoplanes sp. CA-030573 TaxID=3239898 RepID=UPI003D8C7262